MNYGETGSSRRRFVKAAGAVGLLEIIAGVPSALAQLPPNSQRELRVGGDVATELVVQRTPIKLGDRWGSAVTINGSVPGPILRFREGETATLRVTNRLPESTSIHWHGLLVPSPMDGVPGVSFAGIPAGETFTYQFKVRQSGTYWYHSHSALQEQLGQYGPIVIEPASPDPVQFDREYVLVLSDWTFRDPKSAIAKLKKQGGYFNYQQRTLGDFIKDVETVGLRSTIADRMQWAKMRMDPTDILDMTGSTYTYLLNGKPSAQNWTGIFRSGERVRLRIVNSSSMTYFNFRIPGLEMTIVQADGQNVQPITVDEFQIATAETYDVIVEPKGDRAFTLFAESMDRSGFVHGTLTSRDGLTADIPALRKRPLRTMTDMGMEMEMEMGSMSMAGGKGVDNATESPTMNMQGAVMASVTTANVDSSSSPRSNMGVRSADAGASNGHSELSSMSSMPGMDMTAQSLGAKQASQSGSLFNSTDMARRDQPAPNRAESKSEQTMRASHGMDMSANSMASDNSSNVLHQSSDMEGMGSEHSRDSSTHKMFGKESPINGRHGPDTHGAGNTTVAMVQRNRLGEPGTGLANVTHRVLVYNDLKALEPSTDSRVPERELEMHLTGNMEAFIWGIDGKKFSQSGPPPLMRVGERIRLTMINDTMMEHPMHLHGVFMQLNNGGNAAYWPRKHTINVKPAERVSLDFTYDEAGNFAFHCHQLFHMEAGMFRFFNISDSA